MMTSYLVWHHYLTPGKIVPISRPQHLQIMRSQGEGWTPPSTCHVCNLSRPTRGYPNSKITFYQQLLLLFNGKRDNSKAEHAQKRYIRCSVHLMAETVNNLVSKIDLYSNWSQITTHRKKSLVNLSNIGKTSSFTLPTTPQ